MLKDYETRSGTDLRVCGAYVYAKDPETEVLCLAWGPEDAEPMLWVEGEPVPEEFVAAANDPTVIFHAHNAIFERLIYNNVFRKLDARLPFLGPERFDCTLARAAASGWPLKLETLGKAMGLDQLKDPEGSRIVTACTRKYKKTKKGLVEIPKPFNLMPRLWAYCGQDHRAEAAALKKLPPLSPYERQVWLLDQKINDRGVLVDVASARAIKTVVDSLRGEENAIVHAVTHGQVEKVSQAGRLLEWVNTAQEGLALPNLRKETVEAALEREDLIVPVREVLMARADAGGSAVKKIETMLAVADREDHRARGLLQYHGAGTGRWAGRLIQPQNFPRPTGDVDPSLFRVLLEKYGPQEAAEFIRIAYGSPFVAASDALRPLLMAGPGRKIVRGDLNAIEARVLLWLAGHDDAMEVFRSGACLYCETATALYARPIVKGRDKKERQVGKVIVLGCGYQMGPGRYMEHAAASGVFVTEEEAEAHVGLYRTRWWRVPEMWRSFERAIWRACTLGGIHSTNGVDFVVNNYALVCRLPSGRLLRWQHPMIEVNEETGEKQLTVLKADKGAVVRRQLYGGIVAERVTQATARDVLVHGMFLAEKQGLPMILTVHDEDVTEPVDKPVYSAKLLEECMTETPDWLAGCPLAAECEEGYRYGK